MTNQPKSNIDKNDRSKRLCVRVSQEAADILSRQAEKEQITKEDLIDRMIKLGLRKRDGYSVSRYGDHYLNTPVTEDQKVRYKGETGKVQLNYRISATAFEKLERHCAHELKCSKAKGVQDLILNYKFITEEQQERNRKAWEADVKLKEFYGRR